MASLVNLDCREPRVAMEDLGLLDLKALKEKREILDQMDLLVPLEMMESMGRGDPLDQKERRVNQEFKEGQDQEVHLELKVQKAIQVPLVSPEILESKDLVVSRGSLEILVITEERETEEFRVTPDLLGNLVFKDLQESLVCLGLQENKEMLDLPELRVTLAHLDLLAYRGLQETRAPLGQRDLQD